MKIWQVKLDEPDISAVINSQGEAISWRSTIVSLRKDDPECPIDFCIPWCQPASPKGNNKG